VAGAKSPASKRSRRRDSVTTLREKSQAHQPLVSVLLPVFNAEKFITEALESITAQTYDNLEILVIDDGSTDKSMQVIKQFRDARIKIFEDGTQRGVTYRLNQGLMSSKGKYIARMDADDVCSPFRIERQVSKMESDHELVVLGTQAAYIDDIGQITGAPRESPAEHRHIKLRLITSNCILHPSVMLRAEVVRRHLYAAEFPLAQDFELWLRLITQGYCFANLPDVLMLIRRHNSTSTSARRSEQLTFAANALVSYLRSQYDLDVPYEIARALIEPPLLKNTLKSPDRRSPFSIIRDAAGRTLETYESAGRDDLLADQAIGDLIFFAMRYVSRSLFRRPTGYALRDVVGLRAASGEIVSRIPVALRLIARELYSRRRLVKEGDRLKTASV